ncbi:hypothetical protein ACJZ2D_015689 [Fusarium nematophilum]
MSATTTTAPASLAGEVTRQRWARSNPAVEENGAVEESVSEFMTPNNGVTGLEPDTNPPDWPTNHRRVPAHGPPHVHEHWADIAGPAPLRVFLWTMFNGCEMLRWVYQYPTLFGLHNRGYFMYKIAGEW